MGGARSVGLDLAWLIALAGLIAVPAVLAGGAHGGTPLGVLLDGPPVALLAVLAGASAVLAVQQRLAVGHWSAARGETRMRGLLLAFVGAAVLAVGVWLEMVRSAYAAFERWGTPLDAWIYGADIWVLPLEAALRAPLTQLGVTLALLSFAVRLPVRSLAAVTAASLLGGGLVLAAVDEALPSAPFGAPWAPVAEAVRGLLVGDPWTGLSDPWSVLSLVPWVLLGALGGRLLLVARDRGRERALHGALLGGGALLAGAAMATSELALAHLVPGALAFGDAATTRELLGTPGALRAMSAAPVVQLVALPGSGTAAEALRAGGLAIAAVGATGLVGSALLAAVGAGSPLERWMDVAASLHGGPLRAAEPLAVALPDDRSLTYAVRFRAPAEAVWRALTDPRLVPLWLPDPVMPMTRCLIDARAGGGYRFEHRSMLRQPVVLGEYLHFEPPVRLVERQWQEGGRRPPVTASTVLEQQGGVTVLRGHEVFASQRLRDSAVPALGVPAAAFERRAALVEARPADAPSREPPAGPRV